MESNDANLQQLEQYCEQFKTEGAKQPVAAAVAKLVEDAIRNKSYIVYAYDAAQDQQLRLGDVVVVFSVDPHFGVVDKNDDGDLAVTYSTPDGLVQKSFE